MMFKNTDFMPQDASSCNGENTSSTFRQIDYSNASRINGNEARYSHPNDQRTNSSNNRNANTGPRQRSAPIPIDFSRVPPNYVRESRHFQEEDGELMVRFAELLRSDENTWPKSLNEFITGRKSPDNRFEYLAIKHLGPNNLENVVPKTPSGPNDYAYDASESCQQ